MKITLNDYMDLSEKNDPLQDLHAVESTSEVLVKSEKAHAKCTENDPQPHVSENLVGSRPCATNHYLQLKARLKQVAPLVQLTHKNCLLMTIKSHSTHNYPT